MNDEFKIIDVTYNDESISVKIVLVDSNKPYFGTIIHFNEIKMFPQMNKEGMAEGMNVTYDILVKSEQDTLTQQEKDEISDIGENIIKRILSDMADIAINSLSTENET